MAQLIALRCYFTDFRSLMWVSKNLRKATLSNAWMGRSSNKLHVSTVNLRAGPAETRPAHLARLPTALQKKSPFTLKIAHRIAVVASATNFAVDQSMNSMSGLENTGLSYVYQDDSREVSQLCATTWKESKSSAQVEEIAVSISRANGHKSCGVCGKSLKPETGDLIWYVGV